MDLIERISDKNISVGIVGLGYVGIPLSLGFANQEIKVVGFDISEHGINQSTDLVRKDLFIHRAEDNYPFEDNEFDLVISLGCFHNLRIFELEIALAETERVGKKGYVMLESYRNEKEQFNLQCWALTCESFFDHEEWPWIYEHFGYTGDYEFIYFE